MSTLTLNLDDRYTAALDAMATDADMSKTAVLRAALRLYQLVQDRRSKGYEMAFTKDGATFPMLLIDHRLPLFEDRHEYAPDNTAPGAEALPVVRRVKLDPFGGEFESLVRLSDAEAALSTLRDQVARLEREVQNLSAEGMLALKTAPLDVAWIIALAERLAEKHHAYRCARGAEIDQARSERALAREALRAALAAMPVKG